MIGIPLMHEASAWVEERHRAADQARALLAATSEMKRERAHRAAGSPAAHHNRIRSWLSVRLRRLSG